MDFAYKIKSTEENNDTGKVAEKMEWSSSLYFLIVDSSNQWLGPSLSRRRSNWSAHCSRLACNEINSNPYLRQQRQGDGFFFDLSFKGGTSFVLFDSPNYWSFGKIRDDKLVGVFTGKYGFGNFVGIYVTTTLLRFKFTWESSNRTETFDISDIWRDFMPFKEMLIYDNLQLADNSHRWDDGKSLYINQLADDGGKVDSMRVDKVQLKLVSFGPSPEYPDYYRDRSVVRLIGAWNKGHLVDAIIDIFVFGHAIRIAHGEDIVYSGFLKLKDGKMVIQMKSKWEESASSWQQNGFGESFDYKIPLKSFTPDPGFQLHIPNQNTLNAMDRKAGSPVKFSYFGSNGLILGVMPRIGAAEYDPTKEGTGTSTAHWFIFMKYDYVRKMVFGYTFSPEVANSRYVGTVDGYYRKQGVFYLLLTPYARNSWSGRAYKTGFDIDDPDQDLIRSDTDDNFLDIPIRQNLKENGVSPLVLKNPLDLGVQRFVTGIKINSSNTHVEQEDPPCGNLSENLDARYLILDVSRGQDANPGEPQHEKLFFNVKGEGFWSFISSETPDRFSGNCLELKFGQSLSANKFMYLQVIGKDQLLESMAENAQSGLFLSDETKFTMTEEATANNSLEFHNENEPKTIEDATKVLDGLLISYLEPRTFEYAVPEQYWFSFREQDDAIFGVLWSTSTQEDPQYLFGKIDKVQRLLVTYTVHKDQENWGQIYGEYSQGIMSEIYDQNVTDTISGNKMHQYNVKLTRIRKEGDKLEKTIYLVADPENLLKLKPDILQKRTTINLTTGDRIHQLWRSQHTPIPEKMTLDIVRFFCFKNIGR